MKLRFDWVFDESMPLAFICNCMGTDFTSVNLIITGSAEGAPEGFCLHEDNSESRIKK